MKIKLIKYDGTILRHLSMKISCLIIQTTPLLSVSEEWTQYQCQDSCSEHNIVISYWSLVLDDITGTGI